MLTGTTPPKRFSFSRWFLRMMILRVKLFLLACCLAFVGIGFFELFAWIGRGMPRGDDAWLVLLPSLAVLVPWGMLWWNNYSHRGRVIRQFWYHEQMLGYSLRRQRKVSALPAEAILAIQPLKYQDGWRLILSDGQVLYLLENTSNAQQLVNRLTVDRLPLSTKVAGRATLARRHRAGMME